MYSSSFIVYFLEHSLLNQALFSSIFKSGNPILSQLWVVSDNELSLNALGLGPWVSFCFYLQACLQSSTMK